MNELPKTNLFTGKAFDGTLPPGHRKPTPEEKQAYLLKQPGGGGPVFAGVVPTVRPVEVLTLDEALDRLPVPEFLVDGLIARNYVYALTALTGAGKTSLLIHLSYCIAEGRDFAGRKVKPGRVLYLVGENPDDTVPRFLVTAHAMKLKASHPNLCMTIERFDLNNIAEIIGEKVKALGDVALIIVDTGPAFLSMVGGTDENSNDDMLKFARTLRSVKDAMPGGPAIIAAMHPAKGVTEAEHLIPRGGSAFTNEIDGNLTLHSTDMGKTSSLHHTSKFRGAAHFEPIPFRTVQTSNGGRKDASGKETISVYAEPLTAQQAEAENAKGLKGRLAVLATIAEFDHGVSNQTIAIALGWLDYSKQPQASRVSNNTKGLEQQKLIEKIAGTPNWRITAKGKKELAPAKTTPKKPYSEKDWDDENLGE
jgi:hypothetical protein